MVKKETDDEMDEFMKIVVVGHVDHGKSTLIGRLMHGTGSLPEGKIEEIEKSCIELGREIEFAYILDYLREEREKGITIDATQIFFKSRKRDYVIIDAPGHKEFIRNMITGASQADAAVLVVDVREGVMEQTVRHAYLLSLLGIKDVVVAVNKMNLAGYSEERFDKVKDDLRWVFASLGINPGFFVPVNAMGGENLLDISYSMKWYEGPALLEALDSLNIDGGVYSDFFCMPVQDVYGDVIVGRVESGVLEKGQNVMLLPPGAESSVESLLKHDNELDSASMGECIGIRLNMASGAVARGTVIVDRNSANSGVSVRDSVKATIFWISEKEHVVGEPIVMKIATQKSVCRVNRIMKKMDSSSLSDIIDTGEPGASDVILPNEVCEVEIKCDRNVVFSRHNEIDTLYRLVLVVGEEIAAGGIIW